MTITMCCHKIELRECEQCSRMLATKDQLMKGTYKRSQVTLAGHDEFDGRGGSDFTVQRFL